MAQVIYFPKVIMQFSTSSTSLTDAYTVLNKTYVKANTLVVCNTGGTNTTFRLSIAVKGEADAIKQYLFYDAVLPANTNMTFDLPLYFSSGDIIRVKSPAGASVAYSMFGEVGHLET